MLLVSVPYASTHRQTNMSHSDKELLAAEQERPMERQWQASQGLARISLPSRALATPARSGPRELRDSAAFSLHHQLGSSESDDLHKTPVHITKQRQKQQHSNHSTATPVEASVSLSYPRQPPTRLEVGHAPPIVQGIRLVPATDLPDRFRSLFPFPIFNAVQSRSFPVAFSSDDNMVLSAPTGSGKTVIMELAICRLMTSHSNEQFKVVYQAPTKSLCSERFQDWEAKFGALDLQCAELTGDTDYSHLRSVQNASIIITTPEKWDSVTRKWKDHAKLMQLVKLFLIDEVHVLKDSRGATLEAVVSRMKSVGSNVRFVALSATVPNSADIAIWLGKCATAQHLPAHREVFGEEYRPVQLQKFVYGYGVKQNDFVFDSVLTKK
jgi:superfamily II RNA helicase